MLQEHCCPVLHIATPAPMRMVARLPGSRGTWLRSSSKALQCLSCLKQYRPCSTRQAASLSGKAAATPKAPRCAACSTLVEMWGQGMTVRCSSSESNFLGRRNVLVCVLDQQGHVCTSSFYRICFGYWLQGSSAASEDSDIMDDNPWMPKQIQQWQTAYADKVGIAQVPTWSQEIHRLLLPVAGCPAPKACLVHSTSGFFQLLQLLLELSAVHIWVGTGRRP